MLSRIYQELLQINNNANDPKRKWAKYLEKESAEREAQMDKHIKRCVNSLVTKEKCKLKQWEGILYQSGWQKLEKWITIKTAKDVGSWARLGTADSVKLVSLSGEKVITERSICKTALWRWLQSRT